MARAPRRITQPAQPLQRHNHRFQPLAGGQTQCIQRGCVGHAIRRQAMIKLKPLHRAEEAAVIGGRSTGRHIAPRHQMIAQRNHLWPLITGLQLRGRRDIGPAA